MPILRRTGPAAAAVAALMVPTALSGTAAASDAPVASRPQAGEKLQSTVGALGECTWVFCGTVGNHSAANADLRITNNWPPGSGSTAYVKPGQSSRQYFKDTDGFLIPSGCTGVRAWAPDYPGGYWYKITDIYNDTVRLVC
ncbi:hypothetical protein ACFYT4_26190 [Streptomyces sp. NPDC004609]|uniref:hypothetical protein n=1 Tax=Streptomyces sp. NPDC004609 TaxID=3364704 RepID=UPI0036D18237